MELINWIEYNKSISTNQFLNRVKFSTSRVYGYIKLFDQVYQFKMKNGLNRVFKLYDLTPSEFYQRYELLIQNFMNKMKDFSQLEYSRSGKIQYLFTESIPLEIKDTRVIISQFYHKDLHQFCISNSIFYISIL